MDETILGVNIILSKESKKTYDELERDNIELQRENLELRLLIGMLIEAQGGEIRVPDRVAVGFNQHAEIASYKTFESTVYCIVKEDE